MFLNEHFQRLCEIDQKLLNLIRYIYCFFELKFNKLNENNKFLFKFNVINDDNNIKINFNVF